MDMMHALNRIEFIGDLQYPAERDIGRRKLHQHPRTLADDPNRRTDQIQRYRDGEHRIDPRPSVPINHQSSGQDGKRGHQIAEQMQIGRTHVQTVRRIAMQQPRRKTVDDDPQQRQQHHPLRRDLLWMEQPFKRFDDQIDRHGYQQRRIEQRGNDFGPFESERLKRRMGTMGETVRVVCDHEAHDVAKIVGGITEQGHRSREDSADELRQSNDDVENDAKEEFCTA